jgi:hypothetical protein
MIKHSEEFKRESVRTLADQRAAARTGCVGFGGWIGDAEQVAVAVSTF